MKAKGKHKAYNFIAMQGNFNINIPSIPTAKLRFKIQDVKQQGFASKEPRFKDDKTYLTKRFLNSFANLLPLSPPKQTCTDSISQISTNPSSFFRSESDNYRWMVPQNRKNLLIKYEDKYKSYQPSIYNEMKYDRGYSFGKSQKFDSLDNEISKYQSQLPIQTPTIDNYYFKQTEESEDETDEEIKAQNDAQNKKKAKPTAAFKSEDRWKNQERILKAKIKPGPGDYLKDQLAKRRSVTIKKQMNSNPQKQPVSMQRIKHFLQDFSNPEHSLIIPPVNEKEPVKHNSSMFVVDNHDRFGKQMFPIAEQINVPGPGSYIINDNIEERAKKVLILEEQRKLLKEWYYDQ